VELPHVWYFADGDLPPVDEGHPHTAHESLMVLNPTDTDAVLLMDLYWEDRPPTLGIPLAVAAERVRCFRLDRPADVGDVVIPPRTQYALRIRSSVPVVIQYGRLETAHPAYTLMSSSGYHAGLERGQQG
jgi:hypothetical protein